MCNNYAEIVKKFGFVPNGGRIYYNKRSQPPFLTFMVNDYFAETVLRGGGQNGDATFAALTFAALTFAAQTIAAPSQSDTCGADICGVTLAAPTLAATTLAAPTLAAPSQSDTCGADTCGAQSQTVLLVFFLIFDGDNEPY
ncbi:hypothetical protein niasHS_001987 [Heterodera schachtii]|uniref:Trehalase n=1 Tax=Heterodera schachtii TaxID=97005 RepID=A0ABD2K5I1_HETSC